MGVRGDLVAALTTRGYTPDEAAELLRYILDLVSSPDFADRFSAHQGEDQTALYFAAIAFLKSTI